MADIARRIVRMQGIISQATLDQADILQESGLAYQDILRQVSGYLSTGEAELKRLFEEAGATAIQLDGRIYQRAGLEPLPFMQSPALLNILTANLDKTAGTLRNITRTTANAAQAEFIQAASLANMQVSSGLMDSYRAIRNAIGTVSRSGITAIRYGKNGRQHFDQVDVAVRRAVLTGVNQTAAAMQLMRMEEMDWDLLEVTAHAGARYEHAIWQGQVYSRSGAHPRYGSFVEETGYGEGDGLCGWNCRHNFFPYYEGYSTPSYTREELEDLASRTVEYDGKELPLYKATQKQRNMESRVRGIKRELTALNAGIISAEDGGLARYLKDEFGALSSELKKREGEIRDFCRQTGLPRQRFREQKEGFGISVAQKAVWADKTLRGLDPQIH